MATPSRIVLPDFRNLGVILRIVLLTESLRLAISYISSDNLTSAFELYLRQSAAFSPALLLVLLTLFAINPWLGRLNNWKGVAAILCVATISTLVWNALLALSMTQPLTGRGFHNVFSALALTVALLAYFDWRQQRLSPAIADARLLALQARIQPHFLYNSMNTVLGLIREDPRKAETVLENLADLYRSLLAENRALTSLSQELELARVYAEIEAIRLGPRLSLNWQCDAAGNDGLVPQLILQPLIENAIRHGIEPEPNGGTVTIATALDNNNLRITVRNPIAQAGSQPGNRLALDNIRERLALHYDAEAQMETRQKAGEFVITITLPYRRAPSN